MPRLGGALDIVQVSDPATPVAGRQYLYFKSDGNLYTKKPDGSVVPIASGGSGSTAANVVTSANATANKLTVTTAAAMPAAPVDGDLALVTDATVASATNQEVIDARGWADLLLTRLQTAEIAARWATPLIKRSGWYFSNNQVGTSTSVTPLSGRLTLAPIFFQKPTSVDRIALNCVTAGTSGQVVRFGLWTSQADSYLPGTVVLDSGAQSVTVSGIKEATVSATLHGLYWLGAVAQSGTFTGFSQSQSLNVIGNTSPTSVQANSGLSFDGPDPTLALPSLASNIATVYNGANTYPAVVFRSV